MDSADRGHSRRWPSTSAVLGLATGCPFSPESSPAAAVPKASATNRRVRPCQRERRYCRWLTREAVTRLQSSNIAVSAGNGPKLGPVLGRQDDSGVIQRGVIQQRWAGAVAMARANPIPLCQLNKTSTTPCRRPRTRERAYWDPARRKLSAPPRRTRWRWTSPQRPLPLTARSGRCRWRWRHW